MILAPRTPAAVPLSHAMSRKPKKGYFVRGQFIAEGSAEDLELKAELKGGDEPSKTDLKRESTELQKLGEALLTLRADLMERLQLPEKLVESLAAATRITNFEGKRRQMQYIGKLMRALDETQLQAVRDALDVQRQGSASDALALHRAEQWRDKLIADDASLDAWVRAYPATDIQQLRALVRQARKDAPADQDAISKGLAPRHGRAYREIFQLVKEQLEDEGPPSGMATLK
jgi:ribosome-associated protein